MTPEELYGPSISAIPQNRFLGGMANFMKFLEKEKPEFLPESLDVMGLMRQLALPSSQTIENLSYGNSPFTMPPQGTGSMIPQVKTGRKPEVADLIGLISGGVPGAKPVLDVGQKLSTDAMNAYMKMIRETPPIGAINPSAVMPPVPQKSDLGFYSALEQAAIPLQSKGTGTQFLAQLQKTPGVKPEELKWTGLEGFLGSRQNVTKQEIQDYLAANRVDLQEVRSTIPRLPGEEMPGDKGAFLPKFAGYQTPGGENYREILLTLPERKPNSEALAKLEEATKAYKQNASYENYQTLNQARLEVGADWDKMPTAQFKSSHFEQPNILAHMRVNDRVVDGKKTLFIEEVQSDWHQAGRKQGYGPQTETTHEAYYTAPDGQKVSLGFGATQEEAAAAVDSGWKGLVDVKFDSQTKKVGEGVPDAPFKTTWHELALKRAIQEASEKGYDKIAFTTGQTQAARYDLSKQIDEINVVGRTNALTGEQTKSVALDTTKGQSFRLGVNKDGVVDNVNDENISNFIGKSLDEIIGKDLAKKVMDGGSQTISGEGLKVGGEGMKGFYDNILHKSLNNLGKKFDAKVSKSKLDGGDEVWTMDITPKMRESVTTKGQPLFQFAPAIPAAGLLDYEER